MKKVWHTDWLLMFSGKERGREDNIPYIATSQPEAPAATVVPERQHYDLEGGQEMRPRWGRNEGGADGTSGN